MEVQFSNNEGHVIITLCGRLDTSCSMQTKTDIEQYLASHAPIQSVTIDAAQLEYVSSSGLRILLTLTKQYPDFKLMEVNAEVYDVLNRQDHESGAGTTPDECGWLSDHRCWRRGDGLSYQR